MSPEESGAEGRCGARVKVCVEEEGAAGVSDRKLEQGE